MVQKEKKIVEVEYPEQGPRTQCKVRLSNDGKWLIHETIITDIKPVAYYEAAIKNKGESPSSSFKKGDEQ